MPNGIARPKAWVAWSTSPRVQPPSARTVRCGWIDAHALHAGQIDHQAIVACAQAAAVVAAAAHRQQQLLVAGEIDGRNHVAHVRTAHDERRPLVDHTVVDLARFLIIGFARRDKLAAQGGAKPFDYSRL